jgi:preprotein translocase subunit SecA
MIVDTYRNEIEDGSINKESILNEIKTSLNIGEVDALNKDKINANELLEELQRKTLANYETKEREIGDEIREVERVVLLKVVDGKWMDHIDSMDELKNGIGLRAYGQKDPVVQYRVEGGEMFDEMISQIKLEVAKIMLHIVKAESNMKRESRVNITAAGLDESAMNSMDIAGESIPNKIQIEKPQPIVNDGPKVGRNEMCPCGSGKKYKNCCGKNS